MTLREFFEENPVCAVAFSGGVDSAYLLWAGLQAGAEVWPYFVKTPFQPRFELEDAYRLCGQLGVELTVLEVDILSDEAVTSNPPDRCYHCKRALFARLLEAAAADGFPLVLDGSNASDDAGDRPGMRALRELGVRSPLRECGLSKADIRRLAREAELPVWDKPSCACLATRIPAGTAITAEDLARAARGEAALLERGFSDFRLRLRDGGALLQVRRDKLAALFEELIALLRDALALRAGGAPLCPPSCREAVEAVGTALTPGQMLQCVKQLEELRRATTYNVGAGHLCGALAAGLARVRG